MYFFIVVGGGLFESWFQWYFLLRCKRAGQNLYGKQTRLPSWMIRHQLGADGNVKLDHFQTSHKCLYLMFSLSNKKHIRVFEVYTKTHPCFLVSLQYTYVFSRFCPKTQARFCLEKKTHARFLFIWKCETQKNTKKHKKNTSPFYGVQHQTWRTKQDPTAPLICALAGSAAAFNAMGQSQRKEVKNEGADARFTKKATFKPQSSIMYKFHPKKMKLLLHTTKTCQKKLTLLTFL